MANRRMLSRLLRSTGGMTMKALLMLGLLSVPALAKDKPIYSYQSAVLQSFH
jgi:hypothetical protein